MSEQHKVEGTAGQVQMPKRFFSVKEAAFYLGISASSIYNRIHREARDPFPVPVKRIGGRVVFERRDLDAYGDSL